MVFRNKKESEKHHLTKDEEFEILKLVLDKFLWMGTIAILYGVYLLLNKSADVLQGVIVTLIGATILLLFTSVITRNLNYKKD